MRRFLILARRLQAPSPGNFIKSFRVKFYILKLCKISFCLIFCKFNSCFLCQFNGHCFAIAICSFVKEFKSSLSIITSYP